METNKKELNKDELEMNELEKANGAGPITGFNNYMPPRKRQNNEAGNEREDH